MSKSLDADLYEDIYGDDNEFLDGESANGTSTAQPDGAVDEEPVSPVSLGNNSPTAASQAPNLALPAKPSSSAKPSASSSANQSLSYSAQIAQQFSSYQQTPGQERGGMRPNTKPIPNGTQMIPTTIDTTGDTIYGKKPSEMHDYGKLFIGGLSWDTTDEGLKNYFSQFGKVDACTIMRDPSGTSRGFAFLTFEDPSAVTPVLAREHTLDGKMIDPKRAIPREEHLRNTRYFVGGLAPHTTSESMKAFFSTYGSVVDATVMMDRESGRSKGFGFVTFDEGGNADQLVGKLGLLLDDKQIEVKAAQPRSQRDQQRNSGRDGDVPTANTQTSVMPMNFQQMPMMNAMNPMAMMNMGMSRFNAMGGMGNMGMGMGNMANNMAGGGSSAMGGNMAGFNPMGGMGGGMGGMAGMGNMGGNMGMRMGMGPMGAAGAANPVGAMNMGMGTGGGFAGGMQGMMGGMGNMMGGMGNPMAGGMANAMGNRMGMGMGTGMGSGMGMGMGAMGMGRGNMMNQGVGPARMVNRGRHNFHPYARG
ncbi:hypothetical protein EYR40_010427 [Pleurotus pulmonarius]|nr:hypothetical protein EYR40_010427 [Pleurotus pulmonarius]